MFTKMVCEHDRLKRAFVTLLLVLAKRYGVNVVGLTRDAPPADLQKAYRKVVLKCHPDKGGSDADQARLNDARDEWKAAAKSANAKGRPKAAPKASGRKARGKKCRAGNEDAPGKRSAAHTGGGRPGWIKRAA